MDKKQTSNIIPISSMSQNSKFFNRLFTNNFEIRTFFFTCWSIFFVKIEAH